MNNCILMADVVQDPQLRYTPDTQMPVAEMVVQFEGLRDGDPPSTLKVIGWGNLGQDMQAKYHQGDRLILEGRLNINVVDNPMGYKDKIAEMTAQRIHQLAGGEQIVGTSASDPSLMHNPTAPAPMPPMDPAPGTQMPRSAPPIAPQPIAPQPIAPQPIAPQPIAPQPIAPQPMSQQPMGQQQPMSQPPMSQQPMSQQPPIGQQPPINQQQPIAPQPVTAPMGTVPQSVPQSVPQPPAPGVPPAPPQPTEADYDEIPF